MLRFLPGIILLQLATAAVIYALLNAPLEGNPLFVVALLGLILSVLTAFWFGSIAKHMHKDALAKTIDKHAKERETIRVNAERQKTKLVKDSQKQITRETNRAHAKANLKVGAVFAAAIGAGGLMLFTQFVTIGLLILTTSGGALVGYLTRLKQEKKAISRPLRDGAIEYIDAAPVEPEKDQLKEN